jgi:hypothetical protein
MIINKSDLTPQHKLWKPTAPAADVVLDQSPPNDAVTGKKPKLKH